MHVVVDTGAGHVTVLDAAREVGRSLPFGLGDDRAIAHAVRVAMTEAGDPDAGWRLTIMAAGGAQVWTAELLRALVALIRPAPQHVEIAGTEVFGRLPSWVSAAETR